ncbi:Disease resistance protein (CC-NBS-LRR class) family [Euphorbia peplus]|nr:Disease resistance protein (CC-NBS-LRR class) family [Euphorbia peplus]
MAEIAIGLGTTVAESAVSRLADEAVDSVWRQIGYVWNYKSNIEDLKEQLNKLKNERLSLQNSVDEEERNGRLIEAVVTYWFQKADDAINMAENIIEDHQGANKSCFIGCCPNLKTRYQFSRKAKKHTPVFSIVQGERSTIHKISYLLDVQKLEPPKDYEALGSRTDVLNEIVGALKNVDFNLIGVYGMPGVGKTTLATQHLVDEVKRDGVFKVVTWAKVTSTPDLKTIQEDIAAWLGLKFDVVSIQVRAVRLYARLKQEENVLIILDDIWTRIKLDEIGIPNDKDSKGCKVLMTSRYRNVLLAMGVHKYFSLQALEREEAWQLFQKKLDNTLDSNLQPIAFEVSKRCSGLPGLIAAVATALRNQELWEWKDSLERLKQFDHEEIDDQVNSALELSYKFLKTDAKLLFLLCSQNGPLNIDIKYLLKYGLGLGIFKSCNTIEAARIRLHSLVNDLKASCWLLESGDKDGVLHMHDLVHNFAITIASKDQPVITSNRVRDWPDSDILENCVAMVLTDGKVPQYSEALNCHRLRFFLLNNGDLSLEIGNNFFGGMKGLRVLTLKNAYFSSLPLSLQFLKDLQTLCLDSCVLEDVTLIGELKKLQVLSVVNCNIVCLPREIGNLSHLKLLDLKDCSCLELIEPNVLSSLTRLEELYLENSFVKWEDSEANHCKHENANLTELEHLSKLVTVHIHIMDAKMLPKDLPIKQFEVFQILIGEEWDWSVEHKTSRTLKLKLSASHHLERVKRLLMRTEDLYLDDLKGVKNVLDNLDGEGFPHLKHLLVQNSLDIQCIVDWRSMSHVTAFPSLESLSLNNLNKLETICSGPSKMSSFGGLRRLKVGNCSVLRNLFSFSIFKGLEKLEEVDVSSCNILKMFVEDDDDGVDEAIKLEQIRTLTLGHLPQFASFCSQVHRVQKPTIASGESRDEFETSLGLFNDKIEFPNLINLMLLSTGVKNIWSNQLGGLSPYTKNLTSLTVDGCWNLGYIFTSAMVQNLALLEKLEISNCGSMREVIFTESLEEGTVMTTRKILFPKLDLLKLKQLPKLERFCSGSLIDCPLLSVLRVESCPYLQTFVSSSMETVVGVTSLFDEKVSFPKLEVLQIFHMHRLKMIWKVEFLATGSFEKLKFLRVEHAKDLIQLFSSNMFFRGLRNLETLVVKNCDLMEQVFDMEGLGQLKERLVLALRTLNMQNLPSLKRVWNGDTYGKEILSWNNLRSVTAWFCPILKSLFPASIATDLEQLEKLDLACCVILEEIIVKGLETSPTFFFPKLNFIQLFEIFELKHFYPGAHTLEFPMLETLWVNRCEKLQLFALESPKVQETALQPLLSFAQPVPNLKKMTLSYKETMMKQQVHFLFHKLDELQLECFHDEHSLFELLRRFRNIQNLTVHSCDFEELFPPDLAGGDEIVEIFSQIRLLKLNGLNSLRHIWNQQSQYKQVLQNLETLQVVRCEALISVVSPFASFQNLQMLDVEDCFGLINLFESTVAKTLVHLKTLSVQGCNMVKEILATEEDKIQTEISFIKLESLKLYCLKSFVCFSFANGPIKFPSLTEVIVTQCPKMKFFSRGTLYAPKLKKVCVTRESGIFRWVGDLNSTVKQLYLEMVGFDGIKHLDLSEFPELKEKWLVQLPVNFFYNLSSLVVDDCALQSVAIPSNLLPFLTALEKLEIRNCDLLQELFDREWPIADRSFGYLSNLNEFQLIDLPKLRYVWDEIPEDMMDFKNLKLLKFHNCSSLRNILTPTMCLGLAQLKNLQVTSCQMVEEIIAVASKDRTVAPAIVFPLLKCIIFKDLPNLSSFYPGLASVEFPCLTEVTIDGCPQLNITNTRTLSKVVDFPHLKDLEPSSVVIHKIWNCQSLTSLTINGHQDLKLLFSSSVAKSLTHLKKVEISNCGMLEQVIAIDTQEEQVMRLQKIEFLKLKDLPKLAQFCTCDMLECAALKELQIENCPQLRALVSNSTSLNIMPNRELQKTTPALFDEKVVFPNLERMEIIKTENLRMIWSSHLHSYSFSKLEALKVEHGEQLVEIFPHNILARLHSLKDLVIKNCDSLEEVFDIHGVINAKQVEKVTSQLKELDIRNVRNLRCVWNEDPKGVVSFDELSSIYVWKCPNLKSLFPFSIAKSLQQLKYVDLNECGLVELVRKEKGIVETTPMFVYPCLKYLVLWKLENLEFFFSEFHTLDCPALERLSVNECDKLEVFTETTKNPLETHRDKSMFSFSKIISNLKYLSFTSKDAVMVKESQFTSSLFDKLKVVELHCFRSKSEGFPSYLLELFHNMETLHIRCSMFKELFTRDELERALQTLKVLKVETCHNLISLASFSVSFQNLTNLDINNCDELVSLMRLSTARSLVQLQKMSISNCDKVSEIVSNEGSDHERKEEIVFTRLQSLELNNMPSLVSFCSADYSFEFPSMTQVIMNQCPDIKFFSKGDSITPKLKRVQLSAADKGHWNGNLNRTVEQLYCEIVSCD